MSFEMDRIRHLGDHPDAAWGAMSKETFTAKVMPVFGLALLVAAGGIYGGIQVVQTMGMAPLWGAVIVELGLVFTAGMWQRKEGLNKVLFFLYAFLSGMTLVPLLTLAAFKGGLMLIGQALTVTSVTFGGLALYGMTTKRDFTNMGGYLFIGALALIATSLLNMFLFKSGMVGMAVSILGVGIFSAFVVYEMSMIRRVYTDEDWIGAALGLFISFIGLFTMILRLFTAFGSNDD